MADICEIVMSHQGNIKLVIDNYVMTKNRSRGVLYYWRCERRVSMDCHASARTILIDGQHYLRYMGEHNHISDESRKYIIKMFDNLKRNARETDHTSSQIVQMEMMGIPSSVFSSLPSFRALRQIVRRERKKLNIVMNVSDGEDWLSNIEQ